jgi:hypothetical protein
LESDKGRVERLVGRDVEEQGASGLDRGGPERRAAGGAGFALRVGDVGLQRSAGGEQDRADEERDSVGGGADELSVARERADQKARRAQCEE